MMDEIEAREKFEDFLMVLADQADAPETEAANRGIELDLSIAALEMLEQLFVMMAEGADKDTTNRLIVYFARSQGEIVRVQHIRAKHHRAPASLAGAIDKLPWPNFGGTSK